MSSYTKCDKSVQEMANGLMGRFETHALLVKAGVTIDFLFAHAKVDESSNEPIGFALKHHGYRALGICRKLSLKDRAAGRSDAEIVIDGDWWRDAGDEEREALLDHELHHMAVCVNDSDAVLRDDLGRPRLNIRKHDFQVGWFHVIAERHNKWSIERQQARALMSSSGQLYWPEITAAVHPIAKAA